MEQYNSNDNNEIVRPIKIKTNEEKSIDTLTNKIQSLEIFNNQLQTEIMKINRDILRLKDDINSITTTLRRG
jgi:predicted RNase H-like nuclease (RuvC/YqgF family)